MTTFLAVAADVGDPDSTRTVWAIVALLVVMGLALVMLAFWVRRTTRPDPEFLAPLELMDERSWRRGDAVWQRRRLDEVRPEGAVPRARATAPPSLDESFDAGPSATGFDDLHDDHHADPDGHEVDEELDGDADAELEPGLETAGETQDDGAPPDDVPADDERSDEDPSAAADEGESDDPTPTPYDANRPPFDQLPDGEVDESALQRALDELDAELERGRGDR